VEEFAGRRWIATWVMSRAVLLHSTLTAAEADIRDVIPYLKAQVQLPIDLLDPLALGGDHISESHAEGEPVLAKLLAFLPAFDHTGDAQPKCCGAGSHTKR
jgi:hypothetical protein